MIKLIRQWLASRKQRGVVDPNSFDHHDERDRWLDGDWEDAGDHTWDPIR